MFAKLKSRKFRDVTLQVAFVTFLIVLVLTLVLTAIANLRAQGITSGFGFLARSTGWDINFSLIPFNPGDTYARAIMIGIQNSLLVGIISLFIATVIGVMIAVLRTSENTMGRLIGTTYVELFRNVPLLLQLFFWYSILLALPKPRSATVIWDSIALTGRGIYVPFPNTSLASSLGGLVVILIGVVVLLWFMNAGRFKYWDTSKRRLLGWGSLALAVVTCAIIFHIGRPEAGAPLLDVPRLAGLNYKGGLRFGPELISCLVAISIYGSSYIAEVIRAGLNAVSSGQAEAGHALGLSRWKIFIRIRLPLAIRIVMPIMINQYVWLMKATTIGIAVGFADFFFIILTSINQSGQTIELIGILMAGFLAINYTIAWVMNRVNNAIKLKGTQARS